MFVHLHVHSPYSFLDGASSIERYIQKAVEWEMPALALTDHNSLSGAVEFHKLSQKAGIKPIQGAEVTLQDGHHLTLLAEDPQGYQNLCRLLTAKYQEGITWEKLSQYSRGLIALSGCRRSHLSQALLRKQQARALYEAFRLKDIFGKDQVYLEIQNCFLPRSKHLLESMAYLAEKSRLPLVATNNVHYADKHDFPIHDLLICTRTRTTLDEIHPERPLNDENFFASPQEMGNRLADYPRALQNTLEIARRCQVSLNLGEPLFPKFMSDSYSAKDFLAKLTWAGAKKRYSRITKPIRDRLEHELDVINKLGVSDYFLAVWDIVQYAKSQGIRYAGRGSAADSAVAYCLEITNVDSIKRGLLFERFLSVERSQNPDIDIDFDANCRDQVADYVYRKYGEDKVASVCTFSTYYARSILRDFGKALGYSQAELTAITKRIPRVPPDGIREVINRLPELKHHPLHQPKYTKLLDYCQAVTGFPRHIGTHLGGLVVSGQPLTKVTPLQPSAKGVLITQFDKNTIEDLGLIKLDLLSLRTLSAVQQVEESKQISYDAIPADDAKTYQMLGEGNSVGVFQLESPAQRNLQARLQSDRFEDLVASVALIRPGPIKGNMVEPFIARRHGLEQPSYIHPKLKPILEKTYGVVLFQEQVIEIATVVAGFTPGEADRLRRVMTHFRSQEEMNNIGKDFIARAVENGISPDVAETIFSYIVGYAGYGFCEAHAAAFADTAYKTGYLLQHYPAHFYAALLNNQPMGFYPPNTLCVQARQRGIDILPLDILTSEKDFTATENTIRIGLKQVRGIDAKQLESLLTARKSQPFQSLADFVFRTNLAKDVIENLILAGAFDRFNANRRALLWKVAGLIRSRQGSLFLAEDTTTNISDFPVEQRWLKEFQALSLTAKGHIMDFFRPELTKKGFVTSKQIKDKQQGFVKIGGFVIRPHRPPTRSGKTVVFLTLEDEYGLLDAVIFEDIYFRCANALFSSPLLAVEGTINCQGNDKSVIAQKVYPLTSWGR